MRTRLVIFALATFLVLSTSDAAEIVIVEMKSVDGLPTFVPADVTVQIGDTVRWVSMDLDLEHSTCSGTGSADPAYGDLWRSPLLGYGDFFEKQFDDAGEFQYFSIPHEYEGMFGVVRVSSSTNVGDDVEATTWGLIKQKFANILPRE